MRVSAAISTASEERAAFGWVDAVVLLAIFGLLWSVLHFGRGMLVHFDESQMPQLSTNLSRHPVLRGTHGAAHVDRLHVFALIHADCWLCGGKEPDGASIHSPGARCPAVSTGAWLSFGHGRGIHGAFSWQPPRCGVREHFRDLHRTSLEHDVWILPFAGFNSRRHAGSRIHLRAESLAAFYYGRGAGFDAQSDLELDDVLRWRMVFCRTKRGHFRDEQGHQAARPGFVHGNGG